MSERAVPVAIFETDAGKNIHIILNLEFFASINKEVQVLMFSLQN